MLSRIDAAVAARLGDMQKRLLEMGRWLEVDREAIYGSRPWKTWGEAVVSTKAKRDRHFSVRNLRYGGERKQPLEPTSAAQ